MYVILGDSGRLHMRTTVLNVYSSEAYRKNHTLVVGSKLIKPKPFEKSDFFPNFNNVWDKIIMRHGSVTTSNE